MRSRATVVLLVLALAVTAVLMATPGALAASEGIAVAQQPNQDQEAQGGEGQDEGGAGQDDPDAETGANQEETEDATTEATGPPWTYQMARISIALLIFLALGLGYLYYRLVTRRSRGEV